MSWRNLLGAEDFDATAQRLHRRRMAYLRAQLAANIAAGMYASGDASLASTEDALNAADGILRMTCLVGLAECESCDAPLEACLCGASQ